MRLGILTFFYAHNYGAVLQAYALKTYLTDMGHEVQIINYKNQSIEKNYPRHLKPRLGKKDILFPSRWMNSWKEIERCFCSRQTWEEQYTKFERFIESVLEVQTDIDWKEQIKDLDVIFFGSDQIWEKNIVGYNEKVYMGDFKTAAKKVSYAASCYSESSSLDVKLIDQLINFTLISVREKKLAFILQSKLGDSKQVYDVVDPVFLLNPQKYMDIIHDVPAFMNDYVLFYFVAENAELNKISSYIRKKERKNVIEIHYYKTRKISHDWQFANLGPSEFLSLLYYADTVYTNSFHGTAFSLIFHKNFWALNNNMRVTNMLVNLGMQERNIIDFDEWLRKKCSAIDFTKCDKAIKNMIESSKTFINMALQIK